MVIVRLKGGLGNQMFEYAAGRAKALDRGTELKLDATFLNDRTPHPGFTFRSYELAPFNLPARLTFLSRLSFALSVPAVWFALSLASERIGRLLGRRAVYLKDYCQDERYFEKYADTIRRDFVLNDKALEPFRGLADEILKSESVCVHVRRGDTVANKNAIALMAPVGPDYYERAAELVRSKTTRPKFFVFSDDIEWCRTHLPFLHGATYVDHPALIKNAAASVYLMSLCKHSIIANSTFSWWGAWLGRQSGKTVVAPKVWYRARPENGLVPEGWVRL